MIGVNLSLIAQKAEEVQYFEFRLCQKVSCFIIEINLLCLCIWSYLNQDYSFIVSLTWEQSVCTCFSVCMHVFSLYIYIYIYIYIINAQEHNEADTFIYECSVLFLEHKCLKTEVHKCSQTPNWITLDVFRMHCWVLWISRINHL